MVSAPVGALVAIVEGLAKIALNLAVAVPLLLVVGVIVWLLVRAVKGGGRAKAAEQSTEEARIIQDVYHGLEKMERRIEALETILLEKGMKDKE